MKKIYIIWESKEDRPVISREDFGRIVAYTCYENAIAKLKDMLLMGDNINHFMVAEFSLK